jgi:hypothetical protein
MSAIAEMCDVLKRHNGIVQTCGFSANQLRLLAAADDAHYMREFGTPPAGVKKFKDLCLEIARCVDQLSRERGTGFMKKYSAAA